LNVVFFIVNSNHWEELNGRVFTKFAFLMRIAHQYMDWNIDGSFLNDL